MLKGLFRRKTISQILKDSEENQNNEMALNELISYIDENINNNPNSSISMNKIDKFIEEGYTKFIQTVLKFYLIYIFIWKDRRVEEMILCGGDQNFTNFKIYSSCR